MLYMQAILDKNNILTFQDGFIILVSCDFLIILLKTNISNQSLESMFVQIHFILLVYIETNLRLMYHKKSV